MLILRCEVKNQPLFHLPKWPRKSDSKYRSYCCQQLSSNVSCHIKPYPTEAAVILLISLCGTNCSSLSGSCCHSQAQLPLVSNLALDGPSILHTWSFPNMPCCALSLCRCFALCLESFLLSLFDLTATARATSPAVGLLGACSCGRHVC